MTKSDLIEAVSDTSRDWTKKNVEAAVNTIFDAMSDALTRGERIEIRGLGTFRVKERNARVGRNPKTGAPVEIPPRRVPHFIAGKRLKDRVAEP